MRFLWLLQLTSSYFTLINCGTVSSKNKFEAVEKVTGKTCKHIFLDPQDVPHPVQLEESHHVVKRSPEHQMRIRVFYHKSVEDLDSAKRDIVKNKVVPEAVGEWERALKIRRTQAPIRLNRKCRNNQYFLVEEEPGEQYCKAACVPTKCGEFLVPAGHLKPCRTCDEDGRRCRKAAGGGNRESKGIANADFVLYVSAVATTQCQETIGGEAETVAYAAHCQQEAALDRPIAGHTNICPVAIVSGDSAIKSLTSTVKHELLHALGFSASLFAFFRDQNGAPRTPRDESGKPPINHELRVRQWSENTIRQVIRPWKVRTGTLNRMVTLMVTPKVVEEVRSHFNCPSLEGAELEDQGGDGTALTHWEKRLFQDEAMTGTVHTQNPAYSRITFALLEDTGWYKPNYDLAQNITWGREMGCDFATKSCKELMEMSQGGALLQQQPFCSQLMHASPKTTCTDDGRSVGSCNLVQYAEDIPPIYQNFDTVKGLDQADIGKVGGSVTLADFCPYIQEFTWKSDSGQGKSSSRGTRCTNPNNQPGEDSNYALETYGRRKSRCFKQGGPWQQRSCRMLKQWQRYGAGCYTYKCDGGQLHIVVNNVTFTCKTPGQVLDVKLMKNEWLHEGSVICPACDEVCKNCRESEEKSFDTNFEKPKQDSLDGKCGMLMLDLDSGTGQDGKNSLLDFLEGFGIKL